MGGKPRGRLEKRGRGRPGGGLWRLAVATLKEQDSRRMSAGVTSAGEAADARAEPGRVAGSSHPDLESVSPPTESRWALSLAVATQV